MCVFAKCDQFLPVCSYFDTKRPVNCFHIATFPSPTFGPLFAFHCPLFFTKNNNLECRDVLKTVTVTCVCAKFDQFLTNFCPYALISTPNVPYIFFTYQLSNLLPLGDRFLRLSFVFYDKKSLKNRKCSESVSIGVIDEVRSAKR